MFRKLLFAAAFLCCGATSVWAEQVTEGFDSFNCSWNSGWVWVVNLPTGWDISGSNETFGLGNEKGDYRTASPAVAIANTNTSTYLITPELKGEFDFWLKNQTKNYQASVTAYACTYVDGELTLGDVIGTKTLSKVSSPVYENVSFNAVTGTRVALLLSRCYLDDFTYTPYSVTEGASLDVTDYASGSSFDFGTVAGGTTKTFSLVNVGTEALTVSSITVDGGFSITAGADVTSIAVGQYAEVTVATPAADAQGQLTIVSNDTNSPYVINLTSTYKVPVPVMVIPTLAVDFGKVTANASQDVTVSNTGDGVLTVDLASDNTEFTVSPSTLTVPAGESAAFTVTYLYQADAYGKHFAQIKVTPNIGDPVYVNAYAKVLDPATWSEDFSGNQLPGGWKADGGWTFSNGVAKAQYAYGTTSYLTTPALEANAGDELTFRFKSTGSYVDIKAEYSKDGGEYVSCLLIGNRGVMSDFEEESIAVWEPGSYKFRFIADNYELDDFEGMKLDMNAPEMAVSPMEDANFGTKLKAQPEAKTYTITNVGTGTLTGAIESDNEAFTVSKSEFSLAAGESTTFDVALVFDDNYGEKSATISILPDRMTLAEVTIRATATTADPNVWEEDFADGIPATWTNDGFKTDSYTHEGEAYAGYSGGTLITPRLQAAEGAVLTFDVTAADDVDMLKAEWSNDRNGEWTLIADYNATGSQSFVAPAEGYYFLRFSGRYVGVDNFSGFKEAPMAHDASIVSAEISPVGHQYVAYEAALTVEEKAGKAEELTVKFFIGDTQYGDAVVQTVEANSQKTFTVAFTPDAAISGDAYFTVSGTEISLTSSQQHVSIEEAPVWSEDATENPFVEDSYVVAVLDYKAVAGYNTVALPFAVDDLSIFGENVKAYELDSYDNGTLNFKRVYSLVNFTPYIIYVETPSAEPAKFFNVNISAAAVNEDNCSTVRNGATFQGVYATTAAEGKQLVSETDATLAVGDAAARLKAFRAYVILPAGVTQAKVTLDGVATGISVVQYTPADVKGAYNLNGQRVEQPTKGLYIVNGRKVVVK